ncbi:MAG: PHP domain-containing protein [Ruminococcaceae bacterium]|nr:PHP domain-containing protein [Oscillospiraceae bacterium]
MKFVIDHDLHIHSQYSNCSSDPEQNNERILKYAKDNGLKKICLTDHLWDENLPCDFDGYQESCFKKISKALPIPKDDEVEFLFGCETEMDWQNMIGLSYKLYDTFDFIIVPINHLHLTPFTRRVEDDETERRIDLFYRRFDRLLCSDLPFGKVGLAHPTCSLMARDLEQSNEMLEKMDKNVLRELYTRAQKKNLGIEINESTLKFDDRRRALYIEHMTVAKDCGCKFYLGSDAHHPVSFDNSIKNFENAIELLGLTEDDKFDFAK